MSRPTFRSVRAQFDDLAHRYGLDTTPRPGGWLSWECPTCPDCSGKIFEGQRDCPDCDGTGVIAPDKQWRIARELGIPDAYQAQGAWFRRRLHRWYTAANGGKVPPATRERLEELASLRDDPAEYRAELIELWLRYQKKPRTV